MVHVLQDFTRGTPAEPILTGYPIPVQGDILHLAEPWPAYGYHTIVFDSGTPSDTVPGCERLPLGRGNPDAGMKAMRLTELHFKQAPRKVGICGECGLGRRQ